MLRIALIFCLSSALLAGCSSLPEVAAQETALARTGATPGLLSTAGFRAAQGSRRAPGAAVALDQVEREMTARSNGLASRAEALRRAPRATAGSAPAETGAAGSDVMDRAEALKARAEALRQAGESD